MNVEQSHNLYDSTKEGDDRDGFVPVGDNNNHAHVRILFLGNTDYVHDNICGERSTYMGVIK